MASLNEHIHRAEREKDAHNERLGAMRMGIEGLEHLKAHAEELTAEAFGHTYPTKSPSRDAAETLQDRCRQLVFNYVNEMFDKSDPVVQFTIDNVYVVWFSKTLKNHKALLSTTLSDGKYYEVTYNGHDCETYIDVYVKVDNRKVLDR